jgi:hypothetical protein
MLQTVAYGLGDLRDEMVFVGGATIPLYLPADEEGIDYEARATEDVDCAIEIASLQAYHSLEEDLRSRGFCQARGDDVPICRWRIDGITVDVMPTDESILGFANRWYGPGIRAAEGTLLPDGREIRIFTVHHLLASKAEAFQGRGQGDFESSKDFEDFVTVLDGRPAVRQELADAPDEVRDYLREVIREWEAREEFAQTLIGHLPAPRRNLQGARRVLDILRNIG